VSVQIDVTRDVARVTVHDGGPGFDTEAVPDPTKPENMMKQGGRGIFYAKNAVSLKFEDRGRKAILEIKREG